MEKQNLLEKKTESISNKISEKEQNMSKNTNFLHSYTHSHTRTRLQSETINYIWTIDDFHHFYNHLNNLISPAFPETAEYQIKILFQKQSSKIQFFIVTNKSSFISCSITLKSLDTYLICKVVHVFVNKETYLFEHQLDKVLQNVTMSCSLLIIRQSLSNSVHTPLISTNLEVKTPLSICSSCNCKFDDTKVIKFIIKEKSYSVPKQILCATNSSYFKDLCEKIAKKEITNEVKIQNCVDILIFEDILIYIQTGLIRQLVNYEELLKAAHKYDIQDLKLMCEKYLLRKVTENTAVKYVKLALLNDAKCLADHAATIIKLYHDKVIYSEEFQMLQQEDCDKINELIAKSALCKDSKVL